VIAYRATSIFGGFGFPPDVISVAPSWATLVRMSGSRYVPVQSQRFDPRWVTDYLSRSKIGFGWGTPGGLQAFRPSGGVRVLVDQVVEDRSSADLQGVEIGPDAVGNVRFVVGGALGDALVRPGRVVAAPGIQSGPPADVARQ